MKILQRGFVYGLMLSVFNLFPMELYIATGKLGRDTCVENVRDQIDEMYLGINKDTCGRALIGTCTSLYKNYTWFRHKEALQDVTERMQTIESYIPSNMQDDDRMYVLDTLIAQHVLVYYLQQALVRNKIDVLENVTGLTVDRLHRDMHWGSENNIVQRGVKRDALQLFLKKITDKKLLDIMPRVLDNMHFTILYGDDVIQPNSLVMSEDSQYVRATDKANRDVIWNMQTGERVNPEKIELSTTWRSGRTYCDDKKNSIWGVYGHTYGERYQVIDKNDNYCAFAARTVCPDMVNGDFFPKEVAHDRKAIILFKRPQTESYLCQKAFDNSYFKYDELSELCKSDTCKTIEGFPRDNFKRFIENRIAELNPKKSS